MPATQRVNLFLSFLFFLFGLFFLGGFCGFLFGFLFAIHSFTHGVPLGFAVLALGAMTLRPDTLSLVAHACSILRQGGD